MRLYLASNLENERDNIAPIWEVFKDAVDRWVVVDSGSTDGTQAELQRVVGDRLTLIQSDMIKVNGYGYARTKLVEMCEGADWIQIIDGDERMLPEDITLLHALVHDMACQHYDVIRQPRCHYQTWDMDVVEYGGMDRTGPDWREAVRINPDWQARLIRRQMVGGRSTIRWQRRVHELLVGANSVRRELDGTPVIRHFGWLKSDARKQEIADLCNRLYQDDLKRHEHVDTYVLENAAQDATASNPWNKTGGDSESG